MITYLYGLLLNRSAHLVPAHITGLSATLLRVVPCDGAALGALVSTLERAPERGSLDDIRAHDHALQSVVHHGSTTAAVRFGQAFSSDEEVRRHVGERGERIAQLLKEFDGCVEMRILLPLAPESERPSGASVDESLGPGRAYLERVRGRAAGPRTGIGLRDALGPLVRAERVEDLGTRGVVFAHVVTRTDESEYRAALEALPAFASARIVGPLAFYSFAEAVG